MMSGWVVDAENSTVAWANDRRTAEVKLVVEREVLFYRQVVTYTTRLETLPSWTDEEAIGNAFLDHKFEKHYPHLAEQRDRKRLSNSR
jgi:hypothetical protein